jgi:hypothetical protein
MFYFKKVNFNYDDKAKIEAALRKLSIKRTTMLDLKSSTYDIGTDKYFFGYDGKNAVYFTRVKSSVERFLPKIIFSIPKNETDFFYQFRLSIVPLILFVLFVFGLLLNLIFVITGITSFDNFIGPSLFFLIFMALSWLELRITSSKIRKAIKKYQEA